MHAKASDAVRNAGPDKAAERIGVLGGTFNPVHSGHLHLAGEFAKRLSLSRVLLVPTLMPPHKSADDIPLAGDRLEMCRIAVRGRPELAVSDIEIRRGGVSYTYRTLRALHERYPGARLFFLTGADMFLSLESWKNFSEIARLAALCTTARHEGEMAGLLQYAKKLEMAAGAECHVENIPVLDISSTQIRRLVARGGDPGGLLPGGVYGYIREHGLYAGKAEIE